MSTVLARPTPYKGLVPYAEEDAPFFFGRERDREIISANLLASTLTILYGPSGVGKSSVLRAGVAAHLQDVARERAGPDSPPEYILVVFSGWQDDPVPGLLAAVHDSVLEQASIDLDYPAASVELGAVLSEWTGRVGSDLLIILDQFEEYFVYQGGQAAHSRFALEFAKVANQRASRVNWLIGIREDAVAKLDVFKGQIPHLFQNYLRIDHLDRAGARAAILNPIDKYNALTFPELPFTIEPALVDAVLDQLQAGSVTIGTSGEGRSVAEQSPTGRVEAPYLQLVMTRLWNEESTQGSRVLRLGTLNAIGGANRIVRTHLDDAIRTLPAREQQTAARVFRFLVTPSGTKIAHSARDLADYAETREAEVEVALRRLASAELRIIRPISAGIEQGNATRYEIYHDVLASAILDWRARYAKAAELAEAQRRGREEAAVEAARGLGTQLCLVLLIGTVLLTGFIVLQIGTSPDVIASPLSTWLVAGSAFFGWITLIASGDTLRKIWKAFRTTARLGFDPQFAAELMIAPRTTPVSVLARGFEAAKRSNPRVIKLNLLLLRLLSFALALPPVALVLVLAVAARSPIVSPSWVWLFVYGPSVLLILLCAGVQFLQWRVSRRARSSRGTNEHEGASATRPGMSDHPTLLPKYAQFALIACWAVLVAAGWIIVHIATVPLLGEVAWQVAVPVFMRDNRYKLPFFAEGYRVAHDPAISALLAGQIRHDIEYLDPRLDTVRGEKPPGLKLPPVPDELLQIVPPDTLLLHALHGLKPEERSLLQQRAYHPAVDQLRALGHADAMDYWGAAYTPGFTSELASSMRLPVGRFKGNYFAALSLLDRAALAVADGNAAEAEALLRDHISAQLVLFWNATSLNELLFPVARLREGLKALADLYEATNRRVQASTIRGALDAASRPPTEEGNPLQAMTLPTNALNARAFRHGALAALSDPTTPRGIRWELLAMLSLHPCTNIQELIFGSQGDIVPAIEKARADLVRFDSERELFAFVSKVPTTVGKSVPLAPAFRAFWGLARVNAWILGDPRVAGCTIPIIFARQF